MDITNRYSLKFPELLKPYARDEQALEDQVNGLVEQVRDSVKRESTDDTEEKEITDAYGPLGATG